MNPTSGIRNGPQQGSADGTCGRVKNNLIQSGYIGCNIGNGKKTKQQTGTAGPGNRLG